MAISLSKRRIVAATLEALGGTPGTIDRGIFRAPNVAADAIPTIREAKITRFEPVKVERETLRLSLTGMPDIYPGVAIAELTFVAEIGGVPSNSGASTSLSSPVWTDLIRACGYVEVSAQGSPTSAPTAAALATAPRLYTFASQTGGTGSAIRHGETVSVAYATTGGPIAGVCVGDTFTDDDLICVQETSGTAGTGNITITGATSGRATAAFAAANRDTTVVVALKLQSDINLMETISLEAYLDGKRLQLKGCMGNFEIRMVHGDVLHAEFKFTGIVHTYGDTTMPTNANESHYLPPTFLGKDVRFREIDASKTYGKDTGSSVQVGALNNVKYSSGSTVIMRENSLSASGYSFAYITDRKPGGSFNPDEVSESEFSFIDAFIKGRSIRGKALFGSNTSGDGNSIDIITPGMVFSGMADGDRDGINIFDASFDLTGGDYDSSATTEIPGTDNEITLIYR
jgi:hypothetical protein